MTSTSPEWRWWIEAAAGGAIVLALGSLAARLAREPAHRARIVVLTVLGCLVVPWLGALPIAPRWKPVSLPMAAAAGSTPRPAIRPVGDPSASLPRPIGPRTWSAETPGRWPAPTPSGQPTVAIPSPVRTPPIPWSRLAALAYGTVAVGLATWWLIGQAMVLRVAGSAKPVSDRIRGQFLAISGPAGGRVKLLESGRISLPFTFTWARPTILLPASLCGEGDRDDLIYVLGHEWSHVERRDFRAWTMVALAGLVLFYQPLFWWLKRQLRLSQDFLADDRAASLGSPEAYASYLVRLARRRVAGPHLPALGIGDRRSNLYRRVDMLVQDREPWQHRCRTLWSCAAASVAAVVMVMASGLRLDASPASEDPKPQDKSSAPAVEKATKPADPDTPKARDWDGIIVDKENGRPIPGARVLVRIATSRDPRTNGWRDYREAVSETGADGRYRFALSDEEVADRMLYITLEVDHPEHVRYFGGYSYNMILKNETLGERPFFEKLELWPGKAVEGRLLTPEGQPAARVMIQSYSTPDTGDNSLMNGSFGQTRTDADGRFRLPVHREGQAVVWLLPEQYEPSTIPLKNNKRGDLGAITLGRGVRFRGRMLDSEGRPVGKIYVSAGRDQRDRPDDDDVPRGVADMIHRAVLTADDGTFAMGPLPPGKYRVIPDERGWDPATREGAKDAVRRPLPAVFTAQSVVLEDGKEPEPVEIRAVPHVVVEAQMYNSKGEKKPGHDTWLSGQIDGDFWSANGESSAEGTYKFLAPHGLENAQLGLMTNEHSALVHRVTKEAPLSNTREIRLGTLDHDVKGIEIIRYVAPVILVKPIAKDGRPLKEVNVSVNYPGRDPKMGGQYVLKGGATTDVNLEEQGDGRFRTSQLSPDREVVVTARAEGCEPASRTLKLPEGKTEEVELILAPLANPEPAQPATKGSGE